jgi:hypothetical protein
MKILIKDLEVSREEGLAAPNHTERVTGNPAVTPLKEQVPTTRQQSFAATMLAAHNAIISSKIFLLLIAFTSAIPSASQASQPAEPGAHFQWHSSKLAFLWV